MVLVCQWGRITRKHREDPRNRWKSSSADFGWSRAIVAKINIDCWCKRINNASNCRGGPSIHIKDTTDILWGCQDELQSAIAFFKKRNAGTNQILFWRKNFYCWCQNQPEEWPMDAYNPENDCCCQKFPANVHVLGIVSSEGNVMPSHFKKEEIVTKEVYCSFWWT